MIDRRFVLRTSKLNDTLCSVKFISDNLIVYVSCCFYDYGDMPRNCYVWYVTVYNGVCMSEYALLTMRFSTYLETDNWLKQEGYL